MIGATFIRLNLKSLQSFYAKQTRIIVICVRAGWEALGCVPLDFGTANNWGQSLAEGKR